MKTSLLRHKILRGLGALQILFALALGLALLNSHKAYQASIASVLPAATTSLSATAEVLSQVASEVQENRVTLESFITALGSYTDLVAQSKTSAQQMTDLLPAWNKSISDVTRITMDVSKVMKGSADKMGFSVPTGLEFEGIKPRILWSVPLESQAQYLRELASETGELGGNIDTSWSVITNNAAAMSQAFATTCDTTTRLLAETKTAVTKLRKEDLGPAITRLNDAAAGLNAVAQGVSHTTQFVDSLFYLGLAFAVSVFFIGLSIVLIPIRHDDLHSAS